MKNTYPGDNCCGGSGSGTPAVPVSSIVVSPSGVVITAGKWYQGAKATVLPRNATNPVVVWTSSDTHVAVVNPTSGYILGKNPGTATIYATAGENSRIYDTITVDVVSGTVYVRSIELSRTDVTMEPGDSSTVGATVCPFGATNKALNWSSSNPGVATVTSGGTVRAVAVGSATITATAADGSGVSASCTVTVSSNVLVRSVVVSPENKELVKGKTAYLYAQICPENAADKCVFWSSSNPDAVGVNSVSGMIFAKEVGTSLICAAARDGSGAKGYCTVTVKPPILATSVTVLKY